MHDSNNGRYNKKSLLGKNSIKTKSLTMRIKVQQRKTFTRRIKKYHKLKSNLKHENLAGTFDETITQTEQDEDKTGTRQRETWTTYT